MKKFMLILIVLFAVAGVSGIASAELTRIGTVTIEKDYLGSSGRGGGPPGMAAAAGPTTNEYGLIWDDEQGIVWIDYSSGSQEWPDVVSWAEKLNESGALKYAFDAGVKVTWKGDWRLPKTVDGPRKHGYDGSTTAGFNITSSEMGYLFYKSLGNVGYYDTNGNEQKGFAGLKNKGPFQNLKESIYFSGTPYSIYPNHSWHFNFYYGGQDFTAFTNSYAFPGLAVREASVVIK
jgi:hypothetical protein